MAGELVLITGGSGHIGYRVIVEALLAGYKVRAAIRSENKADAIRNAPTIRELNPGENLTFVIVKDILEPNAYEDAVKGVHGVIHVASPMFAGFTPEQWEDKIVKPAVAATISILESAKKEPTVKRVVITSSLFGSIPWSAFGGVNPSEVWSTNPTALPTSRPFGDEIEAYAASKVYALHATNEWIEKNNPQFDIVNMMPAFVFGKNELVTTTNEFFKGTNPMVFAQIAGVHQPQPFTGTTVHLWDVAWAHVHALDPKIPGGSSWALNSNSPEGNVFSDALDIVAKKYPDAVAKGILPNNGTTATIPLKYDARPTEKAFGLNFRPFEEQVTSIVDHFLELKAAES